MAWSFGYDPDILELGITTAASITNWGLERGYQVGLYTNGFRRGNRARVAVGLGRDTGQLERVLLALGRLQPVSMGSFQSLLTQYSHELPYGTRVIAVTVAIHPPVRSALQGLRTRVLWEKRSAHELRSEPENGTTGIGGRDADS